MHNQPDAVMPIIERYKTHRGGCVATLEETLTKHGYLPEAVFRAVADQTADTLVDIYCVALFCKAFGLIPRGKHPTSACLGTVSQVRGRLAARGLPP